MTDIKKKHPYVRVPVNEKFMADVRRVGAIEERSIPSLFKYAVKKYCNDILGDDKKFDEL